MSLEIISESSMDKTDTADISCLIWHGDHLISGSDDGTVKVWTPNLNLVTHFVAHDGLPVYDMATDPVNQTLFTCSSDRRIQKWKMDNEKWNLMDTISGHEETVRKLCFADGILYSGDEAGEVKLWRNDTLFCSCNIIEEIWDLKIQGKRILSVRDRDVVISELNESSSRWWTKKTLSGRGPLFLQENYLCFLDRNGTTILVYGSKEDGYPVLGKLNGHSMIINAVTGKDNLMFSGGWDKRVIAWDLKKLSSVGEIDIGNPVTSMEMSPLGQLYVAGDTIIRQIRPSL